jgi:hypothetical protein
MIDERRKTLSGVSAVSSWVNQVRAALDMLYGFFRFTAGAENVKLEILCTFYNSIITLQQRTPVDCGPVLQDSP